MNKLSNQIQNNFPSEGGEQTFHMASVEMLYAIADEILPNIQFSLTTVQDASLPGIQTYFIYSSRIIGKPSLISIEKFGF